MAKLANPHPGDVLWEDYLIPLGKTADWLANGLQMPLPEVVEILSGKRPITAPTALRLHRFFGASAEFWMHYQAAYDLEEARGCMADKLKQIDRCRMPHLSYDEDGEIIPLAGDGSPLPAGSPR
jgi:addiction module HigA family antidote